MAKLSPVYNAQVSDENGNPAAGWQIETYAANSSTPLAAYTDAAGTVAHSNPIILDALGLPENGPIWLAEGQTYKFVLKDASGIVKDSTKNNVAGVNDTSTDTSQWQSSGVTPTYVGASSFTVPGDQTSEFHAKRRAQFVTTAGTVYGTILSSAYASLTTVTMQMDGASALDAGLSSVSLSILRADNPALPSVINDAPTATLASAATVAIGAASSTNITLTGTTTVAAFDTAPLGVVRRIVYDGAIPMTHNATSLILIGGASRTNAAGDASEFISLGSGNWREIVRQRADGRPVADGVGEMFDWPANSDPPHGLVCSGALVSRTTYARLFAVIGTTWGAGDGSTTFALPLVPGDYTTVQASGNLGTSTVGAVIAHGHTISNFGLLNDTGTGGASGRYANTGGTGTINNTGGAANLAAGVRVRKCIRF